MSESWAVPVAVFANYAKGHIQNVRQSGNFTLADLVIKDASLISDIRNGVVREVACGYTCKYVPSDVLPAFPGALRRIFY